MANDYNRLEEISQKGYRIEFGPVLEKAFENYKRIAPIAGLAFLLLALVLGVLFAAVIGVSVGFKDLSKTLVGFNPENMSGSSMLVMLLVTTLLAALTSPINAGFIKMAYLAEHKREFGLATVLEFYKSNCLRELFIATALIAFFSTGLNYLLTFIGLKFLGMILTYGIAFLTFLTIPLIIFSGLNATQAISISVKLVLRQPLILFGLLVVSLVFMCIGVFILCIGFIFTYPFIFSMYYTIYQSIAQLDEDPLDEIGREA